MNPFNRRRVSPDREPKVFTAELFLFALVLAAFFAFVLLALPH